MSKKHHKHQAPALSVTELKARLERCRAEGRWQQGLDLAKQLHRVDPGPASLGLLKDAYLQRARQLRQQGMAREASAILDVAARLDERNPAWKELLAREAAHAGDPGRAMSLLGPQAAQSPPAAVMGPAVDAAVAQGPAGREALPGPLRPDFDRVARAFAQLEQGQDEQARAALQEVGVRSPFAEWKLLLRGLQAYYHNDDDRAVENWQRLDPQRLPARLAAPFRARVDEGYRKAQPAPAQAALAQQYQKLQGGNLLAPLRALRSQSAQGDSIPQAIHTAANLLPALRQSSPATAARLTTALYWAVLHGSPDDVPLYQRSIGAPPDDPHLNRLRALGYDGAGSFVSAHRYWQAYEKDIAADQARWPGEVGRRARALIWLRMAKNVALLPTREQMKKLPRFLRPLAEQLPQPPEPGAEACFQRCLELAPDLVEAHEALVDSYRLQDQRKKAEQAARRLLELAPDHLPTLEKLAALRGEEEDYPELLALLQRALRHNPLDRRLRARVGHAHMLVARGHAEKGEVELARPHYEAALNLQPAHDRANSLCRWAAAEFKAKENARAEELLAQAAPAAAGPLQVAFVMLTECARLKLPAPLKKRFDGAFNARLAEPPTAAEVSAVAGYCASLQQGGASYHGIKTHAKKIIAYAERSRHLDFTDGQLSHLCEGLMGLGSKRTTRAFIEMGRTRFPANPRFPYLEALTYFDDEEPENTNAWVVIRLLEQAEQKARALPPDDETKVLLADIERRKRTLEALNPFPFGGLGGLGGIFPPGLGFPFDLEDEFEEDDFEPGWEDEEEPPRRRGHPRRRR